MLRFIIFGIMCTENDISISIHPMLRFISSIFLLWLGLWFISIHPMLRFIEREVRVPDMLIVFQYIPCYGLSKQMVFLKSKITHFNTSHVTVYQQAEMACIESNAISIHPMLRFILTTCPGISYKISFQYIPCYGLSDWTEIAKNIVCLFQYIPCYGLSAMLCRFQIYKISFQYIPCYGLSTVFRYVPGRETVFQYIPCYGLSF